MSFLPRRAIFATDNERKFYGKESVKFDIHFMIHLKIFSICLNVNPCIRKLQEASRGLTRMSKILFAAKELYILFASDTTVLKIKREIE